MRTTLPLLIVVAFAAPAAWAQDAFDACEVFTQADAEAALGTTAAPEPVNPKIKRNPKAAITSCTYTGFKDGKAVAAKVEFKFGKAESDVQKAFDEHRLAVQTKPMLISGAEAFWSGKTGQMNLRKGKTWVQMSAGVEKISDRDPDQARKLASFLEKKIQ